jgi:hypothetical protein
MRWHKEVKHDSEDTDTISHPMDGMAWQALDCFDPEFARDPGVFVLVYQLMFSNLKESIIVHTLAC